MAEASPTPSPSHGIGSFEDNVASERLLAAIAAFNHRAAAQDILEDIPPFEPTAEDHQRFRIPKSDRLSRLLHRMRHFSSYREVAWHESEARRIEPFADSD